MTPSSFKRNGLLWDVLIASIFPQRHPNPTRCNISLPTQTGISFVFRRKVKSAIGSLAGLAIIAMNRSRPSKSRPLISIQSLLTHGIFGLVCAYLGLLVGISGRGGGGSGNQMGCTTPVAQPVQQNPDACPPCRQYNLRPPENEKKRSRSANHTFPASMDNFIVDFRAVDRVDLNSLLEIGVPLDDTKTGAEDAIILYSSSRSKPSAKEPKLSAAEATKNCKTVKMILTEPSQPDQCLAIMPQWESFYVHKFMRLPKEGGALDAKAPLRYVSRSHNNKGQQSKVPDIKYHTEPAYKALVEYLNALDATLAELKPILEPIASPNKSIIVSVVNYGQALLFENYICNARAKGLDTSHLFLFATDEKTYKLAQEYGVAVYYNEAIFGEMPEKAANGYGDRIFSKMMMAKVYCVHLVLSCGYNVLFQDVDLVWYRDPLPYLESEELAEWDLMFQDDGARSDRYAPYSPNTGFYFVRHSPETLFIFGMLLREGDVIAKTTSHQAALTAVINEHVSWKGIRVKVWKKGETNPFPGGVEYHRAKAFMKSILQHNQNELDSRLGREATYPDAEPLLQSPYLFHMSWTKNKDNKKLYFEQMGEWYLREGCTDGGDECCLSEPNISCHYRDKPSIISCASSPPIDAGRPSFW